MSISDWPTTERPREKLLNNGAAALSDAELLAIFLRTGAQGKTAVDLGRELLQHFGGISPLLSAELTSFRCFSGVGQAKYAAFQAIRELSSRMLLEDLQGGDALTSPSLTKRYLQSVLGGKPKELFWALLLNNQHQVINSLPLASGTLDSASIYPREVVKTCLAHNAAAVIFAHNHPSGSPTPSEADKAITHKLQQALRTVDIRVLDHLIIADNNAVSMAELGLID
jgi:DNA repair protein RadC